VERLAIAVFSLLAISALLRLLLRRPPPPPPPALGAAEAELSGAGEAELSEAVRQRRAERAARQQRIAEYLERQAQRRRDGARAQRSLVWPLIGDRPGGT
jgi:hypothetical protein